MGLLIELYIYCLIPCVADQTKAPSVNVNVFRWKLSDNISIPNKGVKGFAPRDLLKIAACDSPLFNREMHMQSCNVN